MNRFKKIFILLFGVMACMQENHASDGRILPPYQHPPFRLYGDALRRY